MFGGGEGRGALEWVLGRGGDGGRRGGRTCLLLGIFDVSDCEEASELDNGDVITPTELIVTDRTSRHLTIFNQVSIVFLYGVATPHTMS